MDFFNGAIGITQILLHFTCCFKNVGQSGRHTGLMDFRALFFKSMKISNQLAVRNLSHDIFGYIHRPIKWPMNSQLHLNDFFLGTKKKAKSD